MKNAYIVIREGAHRHEILGVFDNVAYAYMTQDDAVKNEIDNYHSIVVYRCVVNECAVYDKGTPKDIMVELSRRR